MVEAGERDVEDVQLTFTASVIESDTDYRVWLGEQSVVVSGAQLTSGPVGSGFRLAKTQVQRIRLELANPSYYADRLGVSISRIELSAESRVEAAPKIVHQPKSVSVSLGDAVEFRARVVGNPEPTYQWFRLDGGQEKEIDEALTDTYRFAPELTDDGASFYVVAKNALGEARSETAVLTVRDPAANLALGKPAAQSFTGWGGEPSRANDGNTDGIWDNHSVSHTGKEQDPWWQVDLEQVYQLTTANVWNRAASDQCGATTCDQRLKDFYVLASAEPFAQLPLEQLLADDGIKAVQVSGVGGYPSAVNLEGFPARYLRVVLPGADKELALAEVEAFGELPALAPTVGKLNISGDPVDAVEPIISDRPSSKARLGATLRLGVEATGRPEPEIRWQKTSATGPNRVPTG